MKQVLVAESSGKLLDWLVAKCEGATDLIFDGITWSFTLGGKQKVLATGWSESMAFLPSTNWAQGGPIIERKGINLSVNYQDDALSDDMIAVGWKANLWTNTVPGTAGFLQWAYGPTPLVAAMRCYVQARFGKVVEVSDEIFASLTDSANKE